MKATRNVFYFVAISTLVTVICYYHYSTLEMDKPEGMVSQKTDSRRFSSESINSESIDSESTDRQNISHHSSGNQNVSRQSIVSKPSLTKSYSIEEEFAERRKRYLNVCSTDSAGGVKRIFVHKSSRLSVCHTPKVGCTFWKRIMTFLHDKGNRWKSPLDVDRFYVHNTRNSFTYSFGRYMISKFTRVLFTRDPYTRLFSAYVDKIILPDSWSDFGRAIYRLRNLGDPTCPYNITFEDFLHYALYKKSDGHWAPLYDTCNPCKFLPQYVGKMETFSRDAEHILKKSGLGFLLANRNHTSHIEDELSMLIQYHLKIYEVLEINQLCLTYTTLSERLWRAFQVNGYISLDEKFPETVFDSSLKNRKGASPSEIITKIFLERYNLHPKNKTEVRSQRHFVLTKSYQALPMKLREDINRIYSKDFRLFGYDPKPKHIFPIEIK